MPNAIVKSAMCGATIIGFCLLPSSISAQNQIAATPANAAELAEYEKRCNAGSARHCAGAAQAYSGWDGAGAYVAKDLNAAVRWYKLACQGKFPNACNRRIMTQQAIDKQNRANRPQPAPVARRAPAATSWGPMSPMPQANAPFATHVAAAKGVGAVRLGQTECQHLRNNEHIWTGTDMTRWNRLRKAWWGQPQGQRYGRICDYVPPELASFIRSDLKRIAAAPPPPATPAPASGGTYENSSTLRQKWIEETRKKTCYVKDGRRICN